MSFLLLGLSVVLSTGRNLFSKNLSDIRFGTKPFFLCQCALFLCGSAALVLFGKISFGVVAYQTLIYAAVYAILLIFAQWFYTAALVASCVGLFFGCCNLLNTSLAGLLDSAIFFPSLNIGVILLSMICGVIFFKERISKKEIVVLILGGVSILLLNFG